ncbi:hypothetical protein GAY28_28690 [Azospirillum brasilense]|nr:hypothetical protein [Azospirillum brasilense]
MSITAPGSGSTLIASLRSQFQSEFAAVKKAYQETGQLAGTQRIFRSEDGDVTISLSGRKLDDGREVLELTYGIGGAKGALLGRTLSGGINDATGLALPADTRYGGITGSASTEAITSFDDIEAFERDMVASTFETQDERAAHIRQWGVGDGKYVTSREEYRAYNRVEEAATDAAAKLTKRMGFKNPEEESEFYAQANKALSKFMHDGDDRELAELLKRMPADTLKKLKGDLSATDSATQRLIAALNRRLEGGAPHESPASLFSAKSLNVLV